MTPAPTTGEGRRAGETGAGRPDRRGWPAVGRRRPDGGSTIRLMTRSMGAVVHLAGPRRVALAAALVVALVAISTLAVAALETWTDLPDASSAYIPAIVVVAAALGTIPAVAASIVAFLAYDFFFVQPTYTLTVAAPTDWLSLLLFLLVAVVVGRLTALLADREREASQRAREARVLFAISQDLATAPTVTEAIRSVTERLRGETRMTRVWCGLGSTVLDERTIADTARGDVRPALSPRFVLERDPAGGGAAGPDARGGTGTGGKTPAAGRFAWVRVREPLPPGRPAAEGFEAVFRVPVVSSGVALGSLWASRPRALAQPTDETTRFLVAAADQIAGVVERDRLATDATEAEVARQSDTLKSALLDSVSHDLRTPLAAIRVAAGHLADPLVDAPPEAIRESARSIEREAARLDRLVTNVLDLSRIEGGALHPAVEPYDLADLVEQVVDRLASMLARSSVRVEVAADLPPVLVDPILADQILTNLLENAVAHTGPDRIVRVAAARMVPTDPDGPSRVELVVEDSGPGVPPRELGYVFDKFYRGSTRQPGSRGMGIGLAVVRGLAEAMSGSVSARRSSLGGLAVSVVLPAAAEPAES